jgi:hypothetical protein
MRHLRRTLILLALAGSAVALLPSAVASAATTPTWLCRPGATPNPCVTNLTAEKFSPTGQSMGIDKRKASAKNAIDCFYVYPTISNELTPVSDLVVGPEQNSIALYQAAQYSTTCNVYAPMYRQITLNALNGAVVPTAQDAANAYQDVADAFQYYLKHYNKGRGFVIMGHSQGSFTLRRLVGTVIDPSAKLRKQMISAVLIGGNVLIGPGPGGTGGDFKNIPYCRSAKQNGCVIGYSAFNQPVPTPTRFGRPGTTSATQPGQPAPAGVKVLCSNPAGLLGVKSGLVDGLTPEQPFAQGLLSLGISLLGVTAPPSSQPYAEIVGAYKVACSSDNNASVLQVTSVGGAPTPHPSPDATWGLHLLDVGLTWKTMVDVVKTQGQTWIAHQPKPKSKSKHRK